MDNSKLILESKEVETEISLLYLCKAVLRKTWLLLLVAAVTGTFTFFITKGNEKLSYVSSYKNYFYTTRNVSSSMEPRSIMQIYFYVATDDSILQRVTEESKIDLTIDEVKSMVKIDLDINNAISTVSITGEDPDIVYAISENLNNVVRTEIMRKIENCKIETLVSPSKPEIQSSRNTPLKYAVLVAFMFSVLTSLVIIVAEIVEDKVKNVSQLEEKFGIIVLGCIPDEKNSQGKNT